MQKEESLWYKEPARYWDEALPVGNGRLGAMVYGEVIKERIQLNEESFWSGAPINRRNPDASKYFGKIRQLVMEGKVQEAQELAVMALSGTPQSQRSYQSLGELLILSETGAYSGYRRELNLGDAVVRTKYENAQTEYAQEVFVSYPADCMIIRRTAVGENKLCFQCRFDRGHVIDHAYAIDEHTITYDYSNNGMVFSGVLSAVIDQGSTRTVGEFLQIQDAREVILIFTAVTSFRSTEPYKDALSMVRKAEQKTYAELYEQHRVDYQELYQRVELTFAGAENKKSLRERMEEWKENQADVKLLELYFQYGRYLMIAGSRQGGLPLNLQGIWNADNTPPWDSKYTININLQMNYWPVDVCNLSECSEPFFELLKRVVDSGKDTAKEMYGCRGFVVHHNTDIYADTDPQDHYIPASYWVMSGAWLVTHIWEHYLFTRDIAFLKEHFYILREAVLFYQDFLVEDEKGRLLTCPSVSPENTYYIRAGEKACMCVAPAMDNEILYELFTSYLSAAEVLGEKGKLSEEIRRMKEKLPKLEIGKHGQLMEWLEDYDEVEPGHRHISHLFGVYPGNQIDVELTEELAMAARKSLERRLQYGGGHTGWSCAWIVLLWSRFREGQKAYENLAKLLSESTFMNLMDSHPYKNERGAVFQIDGNMGAITGICEMLVQSQNNRIILLPALPRELPTGSVKGIRIRGNAQISMEWEDGDLVYVEINPKSNLHTKLCYQERCITLELEKDKPIRLTQEDLQKTN